MQGKGLWPDRAVTSRYRGNEEYFNKAGPILKKGFVNKGGTTMIRPWLFYSQGFFINQ